MYSGGVQGSLSVGPGGDFPRFKDFFLYALSHEDPVSLLVSVTLLLLFGPSQERRWGTVAFLALSILTVVVLPCLYTLVLFIGSGEASRICGYSAIKLALFTAQCRQVTQKRLLRCLPVWFLPWLLLLIGLLLLPGTPALLHFCAICIGHNYRQPFIGMLQEFEEGRVFDLIPDWMYISTSAKFRLPTYATSQRPGSLSSPLSAYQAATSSISEDRAALSNQSWIEPVPDWLIREAPALSEADALEEQMLRAGILASLQGIPDDPGAKVEVPKSSVSSLRLQQLEKMGFPTEKAVLALAASKQLDSAISLLINDGVGEQAVVVSKGKSHIPPLNT